MVIHYKIKRKVNCINREDPPKYYMTAASFKCIDRDQLIKHMSHNTSMTKEEARMTLDTVYESVLHFLELSFNVGLGDLGHFGVSLRSRGSEDPKSVSADNLREIKPQFTPSKKFYRDVNSIPVEKFPGE